MLRWYFSKATLLGFLCPFFLDEKRAKKIKAGLNAPRSLPSLAPFYDD